VSVLNHSNPTSCTTRTELQCKQSHEETVVRTCPVCFSRASANTRMSHADLVEYRSKIENRLITILNNNVGYYVVKFYNESSEAFLIGTNILNIFREKIPIDSNCILWRNQVPRRVCFNTLLRCSPAFLCCECIVGVWWVSGCLGSGCVVGVRLV